MNEYKYKAINEKGEKVKNRIIANSITEVKQILYNKDYTILDIKEIKQQELRKAGEKLASLNIEPIKAKDKAIFSRQFSILLDTGIQLNDALENLSETTKNPNFRKIIANMKDKIEAGNTLSEAMRDYPKIFSPLYIYMIVAGEAGGSLPVTMNTLADDMEKEEEVVSKVRTAMVNPIILGIGAIITVVILMWKVIPTFQSFFADMGAKLPWLTQWLIDVSNFCLKNGLMIIIGLIILIVGWTMFTKTKNGRIISDTIKIKFPKIGTIFMKVAVLRFARTLENLQKNDVSLMDSLEVVGQTSGNILIENATKNVQVSVQNGMKLNEAMEKEKLFPDLLIQMLKIGEESGDMPRVLNKITQYYQREVDAVLNNLVEIINPVATMILGVVIGGIAIAILWPSWSMLSAMQKGM